MPENEHLSIGDDISPADVYHAERDEAYLRDLRAEEEYWDARSDTLLIQECEAPELQRYQNERLTGDTEKKWFQAIPDFGQFRRGCVLGACSHGHVIPALAAYLIAAHDLASIVRPTRRGQWYRCAPKATMWALKCGKPACGG